MRLLVVFYSLVILASCSQGVSKILKSPDPEYKLRMAEKFYVQKNWNKAQLLYEDIMPYFKGGAQMEDISYKYAYSLYNQGEYLNSGELFKTFLEKFPNSPRAEEMDFMRAYTYYKMSPKAELDQSNTIKAMGLMQGFINMHPASERNKLATEIIEKCREKLERKEYLGAKLYYDKGDYRASAVAFTSLLNNYSDSPLGQEYKLMIVKSYFEFAKLSLEEKKKERFEKVIEEAHDFQDRFPSSSLKSSVDSYIALAKNNIKELKNE